jgi:hypothetical protein
MYSLNVRTGNVRTLAQIKPKFDNLKTKARKTVAANKQAKRHQNWRWTIRIYRH